MKIDKKLYDRYQLLMIKLGKRLEESLELPDEDFFYDRDLFMKTNYDNDSEIYKSNDKRDKKRVRDYCEEGLVVKINQYLRFERFPYETENGVVYNFPKGEKPKFYLKDIFNKERFNTLKRFVRRRK